MDETTIIGSMKKIVKEFCEARDWDQLHNLKDLAIGISTEANELLDIFRLQPGEQMRELMSDQTVRSHIWEELADAPFLLLGFAQIDDIDPYDVLTDKVNKDGQRYTVENSKGKSIKIYGQRLRDILVHSPLL